MLKFDKNTSQEEIYNDFWKQIIEKEDGTIDKEQLMKELHDFYMIMSFVPEVYLELTGGRISKINTFPSAVIAEATEYINGLIQEEVEETIKQMEESFKIRLENILILAGILPEMAKKLTSEIISKTREIEEKA